MSLAGTTRRLDASEVAREPRSLGVLAYFDGYAQGSGSTARTEYPRRLNAAEAEQWRDGWAEGYGERCCHSWHGFLPCDGQHPPTVRDPAWHLDPADELYHRDAARRARLRSAP